MANIIGTQTGFGATPFDATDTAGQACRLYLPPRAKLTATTPLVIYCHPHAADQAIFPGYFSYFLAHAAVQEGWAWVGSNMHGSVWGNASALTDMANARALAATTIGNSWNGKVILLGASMGGTAVGNAVSHASVSNVVGAYCIDGAMSLATMYANATYTAGIKSAYGVASDGSDYSTKTAGYDPLLATTSLFTGIRWRFIASPSDTIVVKTSHADPFASKIAAAPEAGVVTHYGGHLASTGTLPADFVAFVKRCLS